ncbi:hypothetical protein D7V86_07245 [bacterium D16-51]|nr:hypothetical protein D7V96_10380 [bacterium D16-59]RKI60873.1 hypothetical protein D7V86_07245 [bacterium D16-51]
MIFNSRNSGNRVNITINNFKHTLFPKKKNINKLDRNDDIKKRIYGKFSAVPKGRWMAWG